MIMLQKTLHLMCPMIGSDQQQLFNQLELSDIIEARMEEIFELILA